MPDLFGDFNGIDPEAKTEFYEHDQNWSNRMILGDSLQVMASLAEREGLRGKVQCIYFDPPYGIKFNSNWQVSTRSRDVKDGKLDQITREPEQVKAFRDTWKDGIHSYLTYLRDRMTAMRDLLTESGSIFVQIGDENVHRVRALMDEVFGEENFVSEIVFQKTGGQRTTLLANVGDIIIWYAKSKGSLKFRKSYQPKTDEWAIESGYRDFFDPYKLEKCLSSDSPRFQATSLTSQNPGSKFPIIFKGRTINPSSSQWWKTDSNRIERLKKASRIAESGASVRYVRYANDFPVFPRHSIWTDTGGSVGADKTYVVQTAQKVIERCILMATDPGDLVLDPTCGSGTSAFAAEQWGRRWITMDTSRVALALARARLMGARYPYYHLADSPDGREKEQDVSGKIQPDTPTYGDIRQGFVYQRAPHIMLKTIANNAEIDVIWENYQEKALNAAVGENWEEWEIPRDLDAWLQSAAGGKDDRPPAGQAAPAERSPKGDSVSEKAKQLHNNWWKNRIARQKEIDTSIAQKADVEMLYDRPYEDNSKVRVAGPFTVESLSPHRVIPADEDDGTIRALLDADDPQAEPRHKRDAPQPGQDFAQMVMENLKSAGVHQAAKDDRITFTTIEGWPGTYIAAEGRYMEGEVEKRGAIFIGPEFGTVTRADLTAAAREALDSRFDALIACGFNFDAHTGELTKLGPLPILKAKMNPDLHMSDELKNTGAGNLFVVFGEPDIEWNFDDDGNIIVEVLGIDVFDPKTGEVRASGKDDIAAWFIDTDYNEESFFVRHAYFMGANDPYKSLKTSLKAEIDKEAWETLYRDKSRPFGRPSTGRFAVKVINHFGDEVMKVFGV